MSQEFSLSRIGDGAWKVAGELDLATAPAFERTLTTENGGGDLEIDCSDLRFMDSQGVRSVMVVAAARPPGARLVLRSLSPQVRRIADLVQLGAAPGIALED